MKPAVTAIISRLKENNIKEYLLVRANSDNGEHTGKYYPPSGWMENGETEEDAVVRELMEELNLQIKPVKKVADLVGDIPDLMLHFWECELIGGEMKMDEKELNHVGWFTPDQMKLITLYPTTVKLFREYLHEEI